MITLQVLTLFPELIEKFAETGLMQRAVRDGHIALNAIQLRQFAINDYGQVDDSPYGGGSGLVFRPEPAAHAIATAKKQDPSALVISLTPRGKRFDQYVAKELLRSCTERMGGIIFLCSRYEGVDERIAKHYVDVELCLGDFILMGGEVAAMAIMESVVRLIPGVLGNPESTRWESFEHGLLEHPQFTKPQVFEGHSVPDVLLSGNHQLIEQWRKERSFQDTVERRPDLIKHATPRGEVSIALIHYPVTDKNGEVVTSSITNIDLHDIARTMTTYGLARFYCVHPVKTMRRLAQRILDHWATGYGSTYNPNRAEALSCISVVADFDDCLIDIETRTGHLPQLVSTSARAGDKPSLTFSQLRSRLWQSPAPHLIVLGTGWGLAPEVLARADLQLEPINGPTPYNHLSVRSAAAIICDRLFGN